MEEKIVLNKGMYYTEIERIFIPDNISDQDILLVQEYSKKEEVIFVSLSTFGSLAFCERSMDNPIDFIQNYSERFDKQWEPTDILNKDLYILEGSIDSCDGTVYEIPVISTKPIPKEIERVYKKFFNGDYGFYFGQKKIFLNLEFKT